MAEFITIDAEAGFIDYAELQAILGGVLQAAVSGVWSKNRAELEYWGSKEPIISPQIPSITLSEVHEKFSRDSGESSIGEKDLRPEEEKWVTEWSKQKLGSEAIFVTDWPASGAKFYHRLKANDPSIAERFDLIFRGVEVATASMREHRYDKLITQLAAIGADINHPGFKYYLMAFKYGLPPHGGFGMGLERLTEKIVGLSNVKEASLFPRDINRLTP
jgi:aspartyl/asparaginyl-tRNA synthetase